MMSKAGMHLHCLFPKEKTEAQNRYQRAYLVSANVGLAVYLPVTHPAGCTKGC